MLSLPQNEHCQLIKLSSIFDVHMKEKGVIPPCDQQMSLARSGRGRDKLKSKEFFSQLPTHNTLTSDQRHTCWRSSFQFQQRTMKDIVLSWPMTWTINMQWKSVGPDVRELTEDSINFHWWFNYIKFHKKEAKHKMRSTEVHGEQWQT